MAGAPTTPETITVADGNLTIQQNSSGAVAIGIADGTIQITKQPAHGRIRVRGLNATYRSIHPLFSGTDSFDYTITKNGVTSNEATVNDTVTALASGASTHTETYAGGAFQLNGWNTYTSAAGQTTNSIFEFRNGTYNGTPTTMRRMAVYGDNASYAGDTLYNSLFGALPVDGAAGAMKDWPWKADLIQIPECGVDATLSFKISQNNGKIPLVALLLNYDIEKTENNRYEMTGYHVFLNNGGGSATLSRFDQADELATSYLDRWPNTNYGNEAMANPVASGPYKGWNYKNGVWPAGGNLGIGGPLHLAVRYQYDVNTGNTTISYEARQPNGTDLTPGTWDIVVQLTGADSLTPGGGFGIMPVNYHTDSMLLETDIDVAEFKVQCSLP
ncbi:MAG: hypothetical protein V4760_09775 [Bdellovibrionota bacterium]